MENEGSLKRMIGKDQLPGIRGLSLGFRVHKRWI